MNRPAKILFTTSENSGQINAVIDYTYNDDFSEVSIQSYEITGVNDAKYPKSSADMVFKDSFVNDEGELISTVGLLNDTMVFSPVMGKEGESKFTYLTSEDTINVIKSCYVEFG